MVFHITRAGKGSLSLESPVMPAAGTMGYADEYRTLIKLEKLGALVTNPVTLYPRNPAAGTRVVPLDAGVLLHTGLPNPGLDKVIGEHRGKWEKLPVPLILHLMATTLEEVERAMRRIDNEEAIAAVELGVHDDASAEDAAALTQAAVRAAEKPIIVRLPFPASEAMCQAAADAGADALTLCAPPRGTARDANGRLTSGRVYGPLIKPLVLRLVGQLARKLDVPIIGAGGIHSAQDARDYLEAGARAVQVDSVTWIKPQMLEMIARDLGGLVLTQPMGAFADEWHEGMGQTEVNLRAMPDEQAFIPQPKPKRDK
jgi:dihydroorotate dehydrogenase (NAD+) catalytic subunit